MTTTTQMTETQRRAYGIGKDAKATGANLDTELDFMVDEGAVPDTYEVDLYARLGYTAA